MSNFFRGTGYKYDVSPSVVFRAVWGAGRPAALRTEGSARDRPAVCAPVFNWTKVRLGAKWPQVL